ncbi:hypothetical protein CK203_043016 [Vitis vinifera]|uniref:Uncharacterized protein n=1 Tax=Vitis vinifera TaxID=29760 RepID=A0A438GZE0_VITVI|nr:hypothetical protein CK203_043016 [Vitis vinifera]
MFKEIATNVRHGFDKKGSTVHVSNSMQGFLTIQTLNQNESSIVVGNGVKVPMVAPPGHFVYF